VAVRDFTRVETAGNGTFVLSCGFRVFFASRWRSFGIARLEVDTETRTMREAHRIVRANRNTICHILERAIGSRYPTFARSMREG